MFVTDRVNTGEHKRNVDIPYISLDRRISRRVPLCILKGWKVSMRGGSAPQITDWVCRFMCFGTSPCLEDLNRVRE